jgi:hypothetical protein
MLECIKLDVMNKIKEKIKWRFVTLKRHLKKLKRHFVKLKSNSNFAALNLEIYE